MPKVSIVLPTYNGEKYIKESIESILSQTLTDWELIIVNDCSKDTTASIISEYASEDDRIKIITNEQNQKLPESLNIGFRQACGEYLTWTSDDNMYKPQALKTMTDYLDSNQECPMVCANMHIVNSDGQYMYDKCQFSIEQMFCSNCVGACFLYRHSILKTVGEYDKKRFLVEDYDYWLRILFAYGRIDFINEALYRYRVHGNSLSEKREDDIITELLNLRKDYIDELISNLQNRKDLLCRIYFEFKFKNRLDNAISNKLLKTVPELNKICYEEPESHIIVYGAGNYGRSAYEKYHDIIDFYADKNENIVGKAINDIPIISTKDMINNRKDRDIMIAAGPEKIYDFVQYLISNKINRIYIFYPN